MAEWFERLDSTWDMAWAELSRATKDRKSPFRTPVLASVDRDGAPSARMVVLRDVDAPVALEIHTDVRSAKAGELAREPRASLVFWHPRRALQLRLSCRIEQADAARQADIWEGLSPQARAVYQTEPAPGAPMAAPDALSQESAARNLLVLRAAITGFETLHLGKARHGRARFDAVGQGQWIAP